MFARVRKKLFSIQKEDSPEESTVNYLAIPEILQEFVQQLFRRHQRLALDESNEKL